MSWPPDPGDEFESDVHRRVACILVGGEALTPDETWAHVQADDFLDITYDEMIEVIDELSIAGAVDFEQNGKAKVSYAARGVFPGQGDEHGKPFFDHKGKGGH